MERGRLDVGRIGYVAEGDLDPAPLERCPDRRVGDERSDLSLARQQTVDRRQTDLRVGPNDDHWHGLER